MGMSDYDQIDRDAMNDERRNRDSHREPRSPHRWRTLAEVAASRAYVRQMYRVVSQQVATTDPWSSFVYMWMVIGNVERLEWIEREHQKGSNV